MVLDPELGALESEMPASIPEVIDSGSQPDLSRLETVVSKSCTNTSDLRYQYAFRPSKQSFWFN